MFFKPQFQRFDLGGLQQNNPISEYEQMQLGCLPEDWMRVLDWKRNYFVK